MRFTRKAARKIAAIFGIAALLLLAGGFLRARSTELAPTQHSSPGMLALVMPAQAAPEKSEGASNASESKAEEPSVMTEVFHWFNFVLIVAAIVWLVRSMLAPFLTERARLIREEMDRSARAMAEADQRLSSVEEKLKRLNEELAALRNDARRELSGESARIEQAAQVEAEKILNMAEQDIDAAVKSARLDLKRFASELAIGVAERKIRDSLTPETEERILHSFVEELASSAEDGGAAKR